MDFGMFSLMQHRDAAKPAKQVIDEVIEQSQLAERGDCLQTWFAEHDFSNYALCPSPLLMRTAVARATTRIRVATGVVLLPLYCPSRLVSEIAFVDALSYGRLVLGVGSGYQAYEFERFGEDLKDFKDKTAEFLEIIERAIRRVFRLPGQLLCVAENAYFVAPNRRDWEIWMAGDSPVRPAGTGGAQGLWGIDWWQDGWSQYGLGAAPNLYGKFRERGRVGRSGSIRGSKALLRDTGYEGCRVLRGQRSLPDSA